ncbi:hypothetical protein [Cohnella silvisoli]|uniref:DUF4091 domain-containing protein n=1 Tax=Cohnella silvisoli TaxID=2873699 RepID=A0ABV1L2M7_9BACL|nr:hypothetical protein [Cohnella silvisoli]MCD9021626.1 hypothetical protein [Cohnella silvisoli]
MFEKKYEFRKRLEVVHKPDRRDLSLLPEGDELVIGEDWAIVISEQANPLILNIAKDLQDYLFTSMNISLTIVKASSLADWANDRERVIVLGTKDDYPELGGSLQVSRSYRVIAADNRIIVCGFDDRGTGQGSYYLEDLMNLREAPFVSKLDVTREPLFSPRMTHSGWGLDRFPDAHLNAIAHTGMDSILVFVDDVDKTPHGYLDFNDLIAKAASYGLDVYAYSYLKSGKHPEDHGAEAYYDGTYGRLFKECPGFKGVFLCGESSEFPSKDTNTTGMLRLEWPADQPQTKPSPGWWPCYDYPQWLSMVQKVIRKYNAEAEIMFSTYNWGWAPEEERVKLIRSLPEGITLHVIFEMFEQIQHENVTNVCVDYTASFEGPGQYFISEAKAAHESGLKLYTTSNTGGLTWDFGVIPYEPIPYQWTRRHEGLLAARSDWGLSGLMESHHYGWWPSFVSDITKWTYWSSSPSIEETYEAVARRDFSSEAVPFVLGAWKYWSEGIRHYIPTNEDQYGPFRVGPSYPFVFRNSVQIPAIWHANFGNEIVLTNYTPLESARQSLGINRIDVELRSLQSMLLLWEQGNECLEEALRHTPERKQEEGERLLLLNRFIVNSIRTAIHIKTWWKLKQRLFNEQDSSVALSIMEEMERLAELEIANAEATIPLVEADSRLGWEPSMDYMTDAWHLHWKIGQVRTVLESEFADYRKALALTAQ